MNRGQVMMVGLLIMLVLGSALGVVFSKFDSRRQFVQMQERQSTLDGLTEEWRRLQLELQTWAAYGRLEKIARKQLGMRLPRQDEVVVIKRGS